MPFSTTTRRHLSLLLLFLISLSFAPLPLSSTRRILHQPIFSSSSPPPSSPPSPPPPDYPFTTSTPPPNSPFFPNYPSPPAPPPPPPPPSSLASFPANISSLNLPSPSKPKSISPKLIATAVLSTLAAVILLLIGLFLHLKKRQTRPPSLTDDTKTTRSDNTSSNSHITSIIPKLTRPSQTSSEFLYLGTLVNSHVVLNPTPQNPENGRNNSGRSSLNPRKMDSPELQPLPPLNRQNQNNSGRKVEDREEFYSIGSGRVSSIGVGSGSRREYAFVDVGNNNVDVESSSSSSSEYSGSSSVSGSPARSVSSSVSPSISVSPKRPVWRPKSPDLEAIELHPPLISNADHNDVESQVKMCNLVQQNVYVFNPFFRFSSGLDENVGSPERNNNPVKQIEHDSLIKVGGFAVKDNECILELYSSGSSDVSDQSVESPKSVSIPMKENGDSSESYSRVLYQNDQAQERVTSPVMQVGYVSEPYSTSSNVLDHGAESPVKQEIPGLVPSVHLPPPICIPPPPPPPPPMTKLWEQRPRAPPPPPLPRKPISVPPALLTPLIMPRVIESQVLISRMQLPSQLDNHERNEASVQRSDNLDESNERSEETPKPKLKPLHWDKVRASSDREMVWDQLRSSSFKLNEEMIESLFIVKAPNPTHAETTRRQILPLPSQENRVLDPKKSQNIAILLKALHVTVDEVCEALLDGNAETLGTDLLESLLKMAPTKEEEHKLKELKDDSPVKLGPAERFLKEVLDIPFAFKRVDAMLYMTNFDYEVEYLKKSFETLETACEELRNSRMFLKLLEAVLKTGNRMNVGTNRGDAHAFKLDTLLKLVDVKGADGKTTLLHFVVQEITRSEGARISASNQNQTSTTNDDVNCRKLGLQVVSSIASDLTNVKKAATMDSEILNSDFMKLSKGLEKIAEVIRLNDTICSVQSNRNNFSETMNRFMEIAEEEIIRIQAQESVTLTLVKEITEYFHGNSSKEEAHPFRIFMVVRDFITVLERVCKEVGMINERTIVSSAHKFPVPVNPMLQPISSGFPGRRQYSSSDDESPTS